MNFKVGDLVQVKNLNFWGEVVGVHNEKLWVRLGTCGDYMVWNSGGVIPYKVPEISVSLTKEEWDRVRYSMVNEAARLRKENYHDVAKKISDIRHKIAEITTK